MPKNFLKKEVHQMVKLTDDISVLSGIGPKKKEQLASIGIHSVADAIFHAPLRYEDRRERKDIAALSHGEKAINFYNIIIL